ncbi:hypothetical protein [Flavobacterium wongokense]|uniref:hypothetical protein n=1 Tax=Flavobacterium wongokense TaxID=2910674 RepID=UPI001F1FAB51|nr:hypothetical protein [Flavobacterium sp. WG47]MCF6132974.1 hypothetical protein [Flavobacterium sp. WG47]
MKKILCILAFSSLLLTSCSSSDDDSSTTNESDVLVRKSVETYANDGSVVTTNYTYNGRKAVKSEDSDGYYETYTYTGDLLTQIKYYNPDDELEQTETFTYNGSNQVTSYVRAEIMDDIGYKETYVYNGNGTVTSSNYSGDATTQTDDVGSSTIHFSGSEVSLIEMDLGAFITTRTYTYDTKNEPFMNVTGFDKIAFVDSEAIGIHHNILTDSYTDFSGNIITTSTYTYNSMNFPTSVSEIEGTDASSEITTVYTYN